MGVFAYTNALPQLELIRAQMRPGDLLLLRRLNLTPPSASSARQTPSTTRALLYGRG